MGCCHVIPSPRDSVQGLMVEKMTCTMSTTNLGAQEVGLQTMCIVPAKQSTRISMEMMSRN